MKIEKRGFGDYVLVVGGKCIFVKFKRNGRYSTFDGKNHPAWLVWTAGVDTIVVNTKEEAFEVAARLVK